MYSASKTKASQYTAKAFHQRLWTSFCCRQPPRTDPPQKRTARLRGGADGKHFLHLQLHRVCNAHLPVYAAIHPCYHGKSENCGNSLERHYNICNQFDVLSDSVDAVRRCVLLILHKHEQLYTLLHWSIFFVFYLTAYPKESILIRCFNAVVNFIIFAAADISVVLLAGAVDAVFGIHYAEVIASTERWSKWYNLFTTMPVVLLYLAVIPLLKWLYPRLHIQLKNHKQVLCLMTFPLAQFFAIYTLVTILQQFHAIGTSPGMQLLLGQPSY